MTLKFNAGAWPIGRQSTRHQMPNGAIVEVTINWALVQWLARKALDNKTQRSSSGPVLVTVVRKP